MSASSVKLGYVFVWVQDVAKGVRFFEQAFGLKRRVLLDRGDLGWYAEIETGETTLAIADLREAQALFPDGFRQHDPTDLPLAFQFSFVTPDVETAYRSALQAGAIPLAEPRQQPWGQTIARVRGPNGVLISIASPAEAPPPP